MMETMEKKKFEPSRGDNEDKGEYRHAYPQPRDRQLQQNPFTTYRDPQTGRWMVIKPTPA